MAYVVEFAAEVTGIEEGAHPGGKDQTEVIPLGAGSQSFPGLPTAVLGKRCRGGCGERDDAAALACFRRPKS